ncbi:hypothetical protein [Virgisporangium aurantiacum]|uniref:hypothetical protein n=1 Tax=Virgisporangium aurantiacum TaxID=175570 RepID=UPI001950B29F|nr:hypothetical protein [Virgisporangium aurantiacum]
MIVLIGKSWLAMGDGSGRRLIDSDSDWVHHEVRLALGNRKTRVIPVLLNDTPMPSAEALPEPLRALAGRQHRRIEESRWREDVSSLVKELSAERVRRSAARRRKRRYRLAAALVALLLVGAGGWWLVRRLTADEFTRDPELAQFATNVRADVGDCARPEPLVYLGEIGVDQPVGNDANAIVRCAGDQWAAYFISFRNHGKRSDLFNPIRAGKDTWRAFDSWGWEIGPIPAGQVTKVRICYIAGGGNLGIYWEPAQDDDDHARRYAGVLVAGGIEPEVLVKIWDGRT